MDMSSPVNGRRLGIKLTSSKRSIFEQDDDDIEQLIKRSKQDSLKNKQKQKKNNINISLDISKAEKKSTIKTTKRSTKLPSNKSNIEAKAINQDEEQQKANADESRAKTQKNVTIAKRNDSGAPKKRGRPKKAPVEQTSLNEEEKLEKKPVAQMVEQKAKSKPIKESKKAEAAKKELKKQKKTSSSIDTSADESISLLEALEISSDDDGHDSDKRNEDEIFSFSIKPTKKSKKYTKAPHEGTTPTRKSQRVKAQTPQVKKTSNTKSKARLQSAEYSEDVVIPSIEETTAENEPNHPKDHLETIQVPLESARSNMVKVSRRESTATPRRQSLVSRGRRLSSMKGNSILPHDDVPISEYYKHLDYSLPMPHKLKTLVTWICQKLLNDSAKKIVKLKDEAKVLSLLESIKNDSLEIDWWGGQNKDEEFIDMETKARIDFLAKKNQQFLRDIEYSQNFNVKSLPIWVEPEVIEPQIETVCDDDKMNVINQVRARFDKWKKFVEQSRVIEDLSERVTEMRNEIQAYELKRQCTVDAVELLRLF